MVTVETPPPRSAAAAAPPPPSPSGEPYPDRPVTWLRATARGRGLASGGTKAALVNRLRAADAAAAAAAAVAAVAPYATAIALEKEEEEQQQHGGGGDRRAAAATSATSTTTADGLPPQTPAASADGYSALKVVTLRAECKGRGLSATGRKGDLVSRLVAADFS